MAECAVSVTDEGGRVWTMKVEAGSLYAAIFAYNAEQVAGGHREYPTLRPETEITVRVADGRVFRRTFRQVRNWSNRPRGRASV